MDNKNIKLEKIAAGQSRSPMIGKFSVANRESEWTKNSAALADGSGGVGTQNNLSGNVDVTSSAKVGEVLSTDASIALSVDAEVQPSTEVSAVSLAGLNGAMNNIPSASTEMKANHTSVMLGAVQKSSTIRAVNESKISSSASERVSHSFSNDGLTMVGVGPVGGASKITVQEMSRQAALTKPQEMKFPLTNRGENKIVKVIRFVVWVVVLVGLPVGAALYARGRTSVALATRTENVLLQQGSWLLRIMLILGGLNLAWGIWRWIRKRQREQWGIFKTLKKLIGGGVWRILLVLATTLMVLLFLAPWVNAKIIQDVTERDKNLSLMMKIPSDTEAGEDGWYNEVVKWAQQNLLAANRSDEVPLGEALACRDFCAENYQLEPMSARYFYGTAEEFDLDRIQVIAPGLQGASFLGRKNDQWSVLKESSQEVDWTVTDSGDYDAIAVVVVNYSSVDATEFQIRVTAKELAELIEDKTENEIGSDRLEVILTMNDRDCTKIELNRILALPMQLIKAISQIKSDTNYTEWFDSLAQENEAEKTKTIYHEAALCMQPLKSGINYDDAERKLKEVLGAHLEIAKIDLEDEQGRATVLVSYNPFLQRGRVWVLVKVGEDYKLVRLQMEEKVALPR